MVDAQQLFMGAGGEGRENKAWMDEQIEWVSECVTQMEGKARADI